MQSEVVIDAREVCMGKPHQIGKAEWLICWWDQCLVFSHPL